MSQQQPITPRATLTDQLRVRTKFIIDPVVELLARFRLGPDFLTVLGFLTHIFFAYLIAIGEFRWAAVAIAVISPLDALDGALARKLGRKQGGFGAFLDSSLDRLAEIVLFGGFIYYYYSQVDPLMLAVAYLAGGGSLVARVLTGTAPPLWWVTVTADSVAALAALIGLGLIQRGRVTVGMGLVLAPKN